MGHTPALVGPRGCGPTPQGLSDIYCAEETSACRTPIPQTVPTLLPGTPAVSYRPQTRPSGSRCSHPKPPAHVLPQLLLLPVSVINTPWWGRGLWEGRSCATRLLGRGDTGTREVASRCSQPVPFLSPSWGGRCPGSPVALQALDARSHGAGCALAPCPVTVSSRFLLFLFSLQHLPEERTGRRKHNFPL